MPARPGSLAAQLACGEGQLLAGDVGLVTLKALLENGVGYIVTGWSEPANPIDAAIADLHATILAAHGVRLRRLRRLSQLERTLDGPELRGAADGSAGGGGGLRGAVVWNGRGGMRPSLERFCELQVSAPVVGLCLDPGVLASETALVIDAEPAAPSLVRAIDQAFALSHAISRPVLVLLRDRCLNMRGTIRCRDNVAPADAAALAAPQASHAGTEDAIVALGINDVIAPRRRLGVLCGEPLRPAVLRALEEIDALLDGGLRRGAAPPGSPDGASPIEADLPVSLLSLGVRAPLVQEQVEEAFSAVSHVLVLDDVHGGCADRLARHLVRGGIAATRRVERLRYADAASGEVAAAIARWLLDEASELLDDGLADVAADRLAPLVDTHAARGDAAAVRLDGRVPGRAAVLHREVPRQLAAALVLAQDVIGVPSRIDPRRGSYHTETGIVVSVVTAGAFAAHGVGCAVPGGGATGVFVLADDGTSLQAVQAAAGAIGATVEAVDGNRPRAVAQAIGRACTSPRLAPHVIVSVPSVAPVDARRQVGFDRALEGAGRLSFAALDEQACGIAESEDELATGPVLELRDPARAAAGLHGVRELSPAWYDVSVRDDADAAARARQQLRWRLLRGLLKMET